MTAESIILGRKTHRIRNIRMENRRCNHAPGTADAKSSHCVDRSNPASTNKKVIEYLRWSVVIGSDSVGPGSVTHKMPMKDM
ncbi:hypothetical protein B5M09_013914 [Aphanomyces astaci]|uniref:Uncharacterized protein n=1 Tax=Aphanomyces astaci TaxID=112090 RepID=A0A425CQL1_APHAT|nr:hypothetical protein B5M09_013914 [Aphanomyces astaci]